MLHSDSFREDQANEYTTLKKDLEVTTKNCRILSFKLKKSDRKIEQLEVEKQSSAPAALISQIKQLEEELKISNDRLQQMQVCSAICFLCVCLSISSAMLHTFTDRS